MIIDLSRIKTIRLVLVHLYLKKVGVARFEKIVNQKSWKRKFEFRFDFDSFEIISEFKIFFFNFFDFQFFF